LIRSAYFASLVVSATTCAQINIYEGNAFPDTVGWERVGTLDADRQINNGWFEQDADLGVWAPEPIGETDVYQRSISEFVGAPTFFVECRVVTDVPSELFDVSGVATAIVAGGRSGVHYHFTLTDERVRLIRSNFLPITFASIDAAIPHVYRLELYGAELYVWSIDGQVVDAGVPEGAYPAESSVLVWGARHDLYDNTTRWDYVRYGVIPVDASGDFDSSDSVDLFDYYFAHECLTNRRPGINGGPHLDAGPGCRFTDFDFDGDVDLRDLAAFQNHFGQNP